MTDLLRQEIATAATTIVVKVGTRVLTRPDGLLDDERIAQLAEELHRVVGTGRKVALVSSGAVGAGMGRLGLTRAAHRPGPPPGRRRHRAKRPGRGLRTRLATHGRHAAQILLTAEDLDDRIRYLNARNTHPDALRTRGHPDHQRERHGQRRRTADHVRRQRPAGGHRDQPDPAPLLVLLSDVDGALRRRSRASPASSDLRPSRGSTSRSSAWCATRRAG